MSDPDQDADLELLVRLRSGHEVRVGSLTPIGLLEIDLDDQSPQVREILTDLASGVRAAGAHGERCRGTTE